MKNFEDNQLADKNMETISGGKTTDIHKFYSVKSGKLVGQIIIEDGKISKYSGEIPDKYKYLLNEKRK